MSEIEKLYKNAGIEPVTDCEHGCNMVGLTKNCKDCIYVDEIKYPPFTAEKQIELIKWLGELDMLEITRTIREDKAWIINSEFGMSGNVYKHTSRIKSFEEALAELINSLWQDITEEERKQIRDILISI